MAGWVTGGGCVGHAICCGKHVGVCDWQSGVGVDGDAVENLEECLQVGDQRFDLGHGNLQLLDELFPLLRDKRYVAGREEEVFAVRGEECAVRLDGKVGVGQDLQAVLRMVFCGGSSGVVPGHPRASRL